MLSWHSLIVLEIQKPREEHMRSTTKTMRFFNKIHFSFIRITVVCIFQLWETTVTYYLGALAEVELTKGGGEYNMVIEEQYMV